MSLVMTPRTTNIVTTFDSKAAYFRIRPYCHNRGFRLSGCECGAAYAMWHPFGLPSPIRGGQMLADHSRKTVAALSCAIWERKARTIPTKKVGTVPGLFAYSGIRMPGSFFPQKALGGVNNAQRFGTISHDSEIYWCVAIFYFLEPKRH